MIVPNNGHGLLLLLAVVVLTTPLTGDVAADSNSVAAQNITVVGSDLHDEMAHGESYSPMISVENLGEEPVTVMVEYEFNGEPHVGVEESVGSGQMQEIEFWRITIEEIEEFRMQDVEAGTYDHAIVVYVEDQNGYWVEVGSVSGTVEVPESQTTDTSTDSSEPKPTSTNQSDGSEVTVSDDGGDESGIASSDNGDGENEAIDADGTDDAPSRGFFSNDPSSSMAVLNDPAALTWVGILVSIVGIIAQLGWRQ